MDQVYQEFQPDRTLRPFVECGWLRSGSTNRSMRVMPDGCVDVFVTGRGDVMIAGPASTFYDLPASDQEVLAGLRLRTGVAAAVIGCPGKRVHEYARSTQRCFRGLRLSHRRGSRQRGNSQAVYLS